MGILAAVKNGKWQDMVLMAVATIGVTIPSFVIASVLIYIFSFRLNLPPPTESIPGRIYSPRYRLGGYSLRLYGAADAFQSPGSNGTGLYPHRQGERAFGDEGRSETRHEECADPGYHRTGTHCGKT